MSTADLVSEAHEPSDAELIAAVRAGRTAAYGVLYQRYVGAARRTAAAIGFNGTDRDDLVAEAFTATLRALRRGAGPADSFQPYLLRAVRNLAINHRRSAAKMIPHDDVALLEQPLEQADPVVEKWHNDLVARAFSTLPERWRQVLWHTEVEGSSPTEVAEVIGGTGNSVAVLAFRAREGLRRAYLREHLPEVEDRRCRAVISKLGAYVRGGTRAGDTLRVRTHLDECARCAQLAAQLDQLNHGLKAALLPAVLGVPALTSSVFGGTHGTYASVLGAMKTAAVAALAVTGLAVCGGAAKVDSAQPPQPRAQAVAGSTAEPVPGPPVSSVADDSPGPGEVQSTAPSLPPSGTPTSAMAPTTTTSQPVPLASTGSPPPVTLTAQEETQPAESTTTTTTTEVDTSTPTPTTTTRPSCFLVIETPGGPLLCLPRHR
ncbi:sigma-70 family RNA polymerase sigma factor [Lentzea sp. E54]|uniref:sigma-70 family RNA polymerase sigma factor n=1 Tax=Lentzea xerophila TaxID=3435883 RepID=UPI003DA211DB